MEELLNETVSQAELQVKKKTKYKSDYVNVILKTLNISQLNEFRVCVKYFFVTALLK